MEFTAEPVDKKLIQKQDTGINPFLIENNISQIEKTADFLNSQTPLLLVNGFMGTGKVCVVNHALSFLKPDVIILRYNCFETTILDDILLEFFDSFKKLAAQNLISIPKARTENFTQKINAYFESILQPIVVVINSFEQILKDNRQEILDFLYHLSKFYKIKTILISRKFDYDCFKQNYERISVSAFDKGIFEKYLRAQNIKQIGPLSDELYKYSRGYYFYTSLSIKIMKEKHLSLAEFLSAYTKSFLSFNDFILREALSLADPISGHLFRFLTIMRHPVNVKLLQALNLYDAQRIAYFIDNMLLMCEGSLIYLQDYYKVIAENSIAENIAVKIHKSCVELYNTQLPLKPLERDLLISRQTMRNEIEYHRIFIPRKPLLEKNHIKEIQTETLVQAPVTIKEKDEKIKNISFVFESEANETAIMNKIADSINKFVDITNKKSEALDEVKGLSLIELINLGKKEEQNFEYLKAVMIYQKALTLNNDDDYYTFLPLLYTNLAQNFKKLSDWYNSLKYFELAQEFFLSAGDNEKYNRCRYEIANICYITFKRERAEKILNEILKEDVSPNLIIKSKLLLASINGLPVKDILPESTNGVEKSVLCELYFKYALNHDEEGDIKTAVKFYKKCVETSRDINVNAYLSSTLSNLASIYEEEGNITASVKYLQESIRLDELSKNYNGIYISSMKLAGIILSENPEKALNYIEKAKKCAIELNEAFYLASADNAIGDYFYGRNDYKNALKYYENALKSAQDNFTVENIRKIEARIDDIKKVYNEE